MRYLPHAFCVIPARSGSKAIPGKNLIDLCGRPLLEWTISSALKSHHIDTVLVSSDDEDIIKHAISLGAIAPFVRPKHLSADDIHSIHVVLHALDWFKHTFDALPEITVMLLPTSPLRTSSDIGQAFDIYHNSSSDGVVSVVDLGKYMTNLRYINGERLVRLQDDTNPNQQRQGLEKLYSVNGSIFLAKTSALLRNKTFHADNIAPSVMHPLNSIDINSQEDLCFARLVCSSIAPWKDLS